MADASVGNLVVNLTLQTGQLQKSLDETNRQMKGIGSMIESTFKAAGGSLGNFGERIGNVGKAIKKMFGDDAPAAMQKFGSEMQKALGMSNAQVKGLAQSVESLEGAFKLAGQAVNFLLSPLGAVLAAAVGVVAAIGAVKNAMGGADWTKFKQEGRRLLYRATGNQAGLEEVTNEQNPGWDVLSNEMGKTFGTPAASKGAFADVSIVGAFTDSLKSGLGELAPIFDKVKDALSGFLKPGTSQADAKKAANERQKQMEEEAKQASEFRESSRELWEYLDKSAQDELDEFLEHDRKMNGIIQERQKAEIDAQQNLRDLADKAIADAKQMMSEANAKMQARWQAVGSGQFGTAFGMSGTAGAAFNIAGGAMANAGPNTSAVLQGASTGGQAGGGWGALVGAIVALAMRTSSIAKLFQIIEDVLGKILPVLDEVLRPVLLSLEPPLKMLGQVLGVVGNLFKLFNNLLKPLEQLNNGMLSLFDCIGQLVSAIGSASNSVTSMMDTKVEWKTDQGNTAGMSMNDLTDWLTLGKVFGGISNEINGKDFLTGQQKGGTEVGINFELMNQKTVFAAQSLANFAQATRQSTYTLELLSTSGGAEAYINAQVEAAKVQAKQTELDAEVAKRLGTLGLASDKAAESLAKFSDSLINATPGYRLAAAGYNSTTAGGPLQNTPQSAQTQVSVYIDGAQVAAAVEVRNERMESLGAARPLAASRGM